MGWLISIGLLIMGLFLKNDTMIMSSGLFAIAGSIAFASITRKANKTDKE